MTSPVGVGSLQSTFRMRRLLLRAPDFSSSILFLRDSSTSMQPLRPEEIQSFQKEVYPCGQEEGGEGGEERGEGRGERKEGRGWEVRRGERKEGGKERGGDGDMWEGMEGKERGGERREERGREMGKRGRWRERQGRKGIALCMCVSVLAYL